MQTITEVCPDYFGSKPEKVLQFGEGNFLRAFADWMIELANRQGIFEGSVVVCQPIAQGMGETLNQQDGLYTLIMRGRENGRERSEHLCISSLSRCINPYEDYQALLKVAENPELEVIISNTTEAGIAYREAQSPQDRPPTSFPAKLTVFLHHRFTTLGGEPDTGLLILPVELIDNNGSHLKTLVLRHASEWGYSSAFTDWLNRHVCFANTLVDRIVTGYPAVEIDAIQNQMGYRDDALVTSELFNLWVIEADPAWAERFPIHKTEANVIWTDDATPYKKRKVRILNGAHTAMVLAASMAGHETVLDCMQDEVFRSFLQDLLFEEVIPSLDLPEEDLVPFARSVLDRFDNPFIRHRLLDIALNSCSKFMARCWPSLEDYQRKTGRLPARLVYAMAAFIAFYRGVNGENGYEGTRPDGSTYPIRDDAPVLAAFDHVWNGPAADDFHALVAKLFTDSDIWGTAAPAQIPGLAAAVAEELRAIGVSGPRGALINLRDRWPALSPRATKENL